LGITDDMIKKICPSSGTSPSSGTNAFQKPVKEE
jgi:hypothetical protein